MSKILIQIVMDLWLTIDLVSVEAMSKILRHCLCRSPPACVYSVHRQEGGQITGYECFLLNMKTLFKIFV